MTTTTPVLLPEKVNAGQATRILTLVASAWLVVATAGQWLFGVYILLFYGKSTITGDFDRWNTVLPHGYVEGDWKGNLIMGAHVLLAAVIDHWGTTATDSSGPPACAPFSSLAWPRIRYYGYYRQHGGPDYGLDTRHGG